MSNSSLDPKEIERRLHNLTPRQCQVLYWVGRGLVYKEIAKLMRCSQDLIQKEMSLMYQTLGLKPLRTSEKRRLLNTQICPIHQRMVSDPERDCASGVIDATPPTIDEETLKEVIEDEQKGLVPLDVALIRRVQQGPEESPEGNGRQQRLTPVLPNSKSPAPSYRQQSPLPWILVGILGTLLCVAAAGIVVLLTQQGAKPTVTAVASGPTAQPSTTIAPTIAPLLPPPSPQPTYTTLPTYTPFPTFTPIPTLPGPTETKAVPAATQSTAQRSPVAAGKSIESSGIAVYTSSTVKAWTSTVLQLQVLVRNNRSQSYLLRYTCAAFHLTDDAGKEYSPNESSSTLNKVYQETINSGQEVGVGCGNQYLYFNGPVSLQAKNLVLTIDELAGMTNLSWRFDLQ